MLLAKGQFSAYNEVFISSNGADLRLQTVGSLIWNSKEGGIRRSAYNAVSVRQKNQNNYSFWTTFVPILLGFACFLLDLKGFQFGMLADILRKFQWYLKYSWISFLFLLFVRARNAIQAGSILKYSKSEMKQFWCIYWDFLGWTHIKCKKESYRKSSVFSRTFQYHTASRNLNYP